MRFLLCDSSREPPMNLPHWDGSVATAFTKLRRSIEGVNLTDPSWLTAERAWSLALTFSAEVSGPGFGSSQDARPRFRLSSRPPPLDTFHSGRYFFFCSPKDKARASYVG